MPGMNDALELFNIIYGVIIGIIGLGGVAYGGWNFFDGFSNDQPESKKKGIITLLVTVFAIILMLSAKPIILRLAGISA